MGQLIKSTCRCMVKNRVEENQFYQKINSPDKQKKNAYVVINNNGILEQQSINLQPRDYEQQQNDQNCESPNIQDSSQIQCNSQQDIELKDYKPIKQLGKGAFGKVLLVQYQKTKKFYAMKVINKFDVIQQHLIQNVILEKNILQNCSSPFLVKLYHAFQTEKKLYLVMEYIQGGELYHLMKKMGSFSESSARFYLAEVICGLQYLHQKMNIVYRDLKPENIMLCIDGHIKMIDFGLSKSFNNLGHTFVGTPEYLAPEVILGKEHTKAIDFWTLGVLLFEMINGAPPFYDESGNNRNYAKIEDKIIKNQPFFSQKFSLQAKDLIQSLLQTDPQKRLGIKGFNEIKEHPFFQKIDWKKVEERKTIPPHQNTTPLTQNEHNIKQDIIKETPMEHPRHLINIPDFSHKNIYFDENTESLSQRKLIKINSKEYSQKF